MNTYIVGSDILQTVPPTAPYCDGNLLWIASHASRVICITWVYLTKAGWNINFASSNFKGYRTQSLDTS